MANFIQLSYKGAHWGYLITLLFRAIQRRMAPSLCQPLTQCGQWCPAEHVFWDCWHSLRKNPCSWQAAWTVELCVLFNSFQLCEECCDLFFLQLSHLTVKLMFAMFFEVWSNSLRGSCFQFLILLQTWPSLLHAIWQKHYPLFLS